MDIRAAGAAAVLALAFAGTAAAAYGGKRMADAEHKTAVGLRLTSPAFKPMGRIPRDHTGEGRDLSPELRWEGEPAQAKSIALIMDDPDAPPGTWVHWVLYDLPAGRGLLPSGVPKKESVLDGAKQGRCWGVDSFERIGYYGPLPPPGAPHRYFFKLYALDKALGLKAGAAKAEVMEAMQGHILAQAELVGTYQR